MVMRLLAPARPARQGRRRRARPGDLPRPCRAAASPRSRARRRSRRAATRTTRAVAATESTPGEARAASAPTAVTPTRPERPAGSSGDNRRPMYALFEDGRQVPRRPGDERDRDLAADRARLGQARQGQGGQRAAALRAARARGADRRGRALAREIDLDLAWEFAPEGEFGFAELARDYFGAKRRRRRSRRRRCSRLFAAPHYFRRLGKGNFKKAPEEIVKAALLGIERKKQVAAQVDAWAERARRRHLPGAGARAALPHPVQAGQERARVQGRRRGGAAHRPARRSSC